jgi:hypothetical protein
MSIFSVSLTLFSVGAIIYLAVKRKIKENIFSIALMCFGYIFIFSILIGRAKAGIIQPDASRYVTFIQMCYIGLILICFQNIFSNVKKRIFAAIIIVMFCFFESRQARLYNEGGVLCLDMVKAALKVKDYKTQENINGNIVWHLWNKEQFILRIRLLEQNKWSIFAKKEENKDYKKLLKSIDISDDITITEQKNGGK